MRLTFVRLATLALIGFAAIAPAAAGAQPRGLSSLPPGVYPLNPQPLPPRKMPTYSPVSRRALNPQPLPPG